LLVRGRVDADLVANPMTGHIESNAVVLSEDPSIPVSLGQVPIVLDAWMLLRMGRRDPAWSDSLARRVEAREFATVVLTRPLEGNETWYRTVHFGRLIAEAIQRNYRFSERVATYDLYVPKAPE
jgi:hypothetical protein